MTANAEFEMVREEALNRWVIKLAREVEVDFMMKCSYRDGFEDARKILATPPSPDAREAVGGVALTDEQTRIHQLERALVYVAHMMHSEPQYMLAEGITLGDVNFVRVHVGDLNVQTSIPEDDARSLYAAARETTERKAADRLAILREAGSN